jgi:hypothetical protein
MVALITGTEVYKGKGKGNAVPITCHDGAEGGGIVTAVPLMISR